MRWFSPPMIIATAAMHPGRENVDAFGHIGDTYDLLSADGSLSSSTDGGRHLLELLGVHSIEFGPIACSSQSIRVSWMSLDQV